MGYDGKIMRLAQSRFEADREERSRLLQERRESIFARRPRLREIEGELRAATSRIVASAFQRGTDPLPALRRLRDENLSLQEEKSRLLAEMGLPADALDERPVCPLCEDRGYRDGAVCRCLRKYYAREQQKELSRMLDLGNQSFDTFLLDYYSEAPDPDFGTSPRRNMEAVYDICADYAHGFGRRPRNLLLFGAPGLGKTFLSAAIAREVSGEGWSVVYDTAGHVFELFETRKFGREEYEEASADVERILKCDLLILDDLGTELTTDFVRSALYQIINTRLMEQKSTILSTNLMPSEIARRYSAQVSSRLEGEYQLLAFYGEDIRKLKKSRQESRM